MGKLSCLQCLFFLSCCAASTVLGCVLMLAFKKVLVVLVIHQFAEDLNLALLSRIPSASIIKPESLIQSVLLNCVQGSLIFGSCRKQILRTNRCIQNSLTILNISCAWDYKARQHKKRHFLFH